MLDNTALMAHHPEPRGGRKVRSTDHPRRGVSSLTASGALSLVAPVVLFSGLTYLGAMLRIPLRPVPITMQTLPVLLAGAFAGARKGSLSQALYLAGGAAGLPVFAGSAGGLSVLAGPTGGYLAGFMIAPLIVGSLLPLRRGLFWSVACFSLGALSILALGTVHLAVFLHQDWTRAFLLGVVPFLPGEALKVTLAAGLYRRFGP